MMKLQKQNQLKKLSRKKTQSTLLTHYLGYKIKITQKKKLKQIMNFKTQ